MMQLTDHVIASTWIGCKDMFRYEIKLIPVTQLTTQLVWSVEFIVDA